MKRADDVAMTPGDQTRPFTTLHVLQAEHGFRILSLIQGAPSLSAPASRFFAIPALLAVTALTVMPRAAVAAYCSGGSRMACSEGVDRSGRTPGAMYDAAAEGLREARTPAEKELARRAMRDAFDPSMSDPRAVACNRNPGPPGSFAACVAGTGPRPGLAMVLECQQNLSDGRILVDGRSLPAGARYRVVRYRPRAADPGWSHGTCEIVFTAS
jgi:hypothetical protein